MTLRKPSALGFHHYLFLNTLENIIELNSMTELAIETRIKEFQHNLNSQSIEMELTEDEKFEFFEHNSDEYWKYADDFPSILRQSLFIHSYFSFEMYMKMSGKTIKKNFKTIYSMSDLKGDTLQSFKLFINKSLEINPIFGEIEWKNIKFYNQLRNHLAHNDGFIGDDKKSQVIKNKILTLPNIEVKHGSIYLHKNFNNLVVSDFHSFAYKLNSELSLILNS